MYARDIREGTIVRFYYTNGSRGPGFRTVQVNTVGDGFLKGVDLDVNEFRTFNFKSVSASYAIEQVADAGETLVRPSEFLAVAADKLDGNTLVSIYKQLNPDAVEVRHVASLKALVVRFGRDPVISVAIEKEGVRVSFVNKDGKAIYLDFGGDHGVSFTGPTVLDCKMSPVQARQFVSKLALHFGAETTANWTDALFGRK